MKEAEARTADAEPGGDVVGLESRADYSEQALADRSIGFLEARADEWMADTGVQRMFNAIASVFEKHAPQEIMDRFREQLGAIGHQCHVEGALRVWEEISTQQRAIGRPLPRSADELAALNATQPTDAEVRREALEEAARIAEQVVVLLPIGTPGEGHVTLNDRAVNETRASIAAAIRQHKDDGR
jgi:hypothetical protein